MKILLNFGPVSGNRLSGIGQHSLNLYQSIKKIEYCDIANYSKLKYFPPVIKRFSYNLITNFETKPENYDIVHFLTHYVPYLKKGYKKVVTIHDLIPYKCPETIPSIWRYYNKISTRDSCERADAIITLSEFTKHEILNLFPYISENKIFVCGGGLRDIFFNYNPREEDLSKIFLHPYTYFLFVGDITFRKNLVNLIKVFKQAKAQNFVDKSTKLIIAGKRGYSYNTIKKFIDQIEVIELGYIDDQTLVSLYKFAKAFIFPSIYEGYGMPLLEAMSQNCPIIASNIATNFELNSSHGNQMFIFKNEDLNDLVIKLGELDRNFHQIRNSINYRNLDIHRYDEIAKNHINVYKTILNAS